MILVRKENGNEREWKKITLFNFLVAELKMTRLYKNVEITQLWSEMLGERMNLENDF